MTVKEKLKETLINHGLNQNEAEKVLKKINAFTNFQDQQWRKYSKQFHINCWIVVKKTALEYIDNECPQHLARKCFV